jgi:hypothetical protein
VYRQTGSPDTLDAFEVSVMHVDAAWLTSFAVGTRIILFGLWECKDAETGSRKSAKQQGKSITYISHKLTLRPKFKLQVLKAY